MTAAHSPHTLTSPKVGDYNQTSPVAQAWLKHTVWRTVTVAFLVSVGCSWLWCGRSAMHGFVGGRFHRENCRLVARIGGHVAEVESERWSVSSPANRNRSTSSTSYIKRVAKVKVQYS